MSNSKLNKLKSGIKYGTEVTLNLSSNLIGNFNDGTSFPHTDTQVSRLRKAFANGPSANIRFLEPQSSKMIQSGGILANLLTVIYKQCF